MIGAGDGNTGTNNSTSLVQSVTLRALGFPLHQFDFGT
jgi:hypothetical protein